MQYNILFIFLIILFLLCIFFTSKKEACFDLFSFKNTTQLRGLAILLIVLCHFSVHLLWLPDENNIFAFMGKYGVGIFLFLSGFGLTLSYLAKGIQKAWFVKRYVRIWFPYVCVTLIWILFDRIFLNQVHSFAYLFMTFLGMIFIQNKESVDPNMWYITFLLFEYVFFFLIFRIKRISDLEKLVLITIIIPLFALFHDFLLKEYYPHTVILWSVFYLTAFPCGIFFGLFYSKFRTLFHSMHFPKKQRGLFLLFFVFIAFFESFLLKDNNFWGTIFFVFLFFFYTFLGYTSKFLYFLGSISFELYLLHGPLMYRYDFLLYRGSLFITFPVYFIVLCCIAFVLKKIMDCCFRFEIVTNPIRLFQKI